MPGGIPGDYSVGMTMAAHGTGVELTDPADAVYDTGGPRFRAGEFSIR